MLLCTYWNINTVTYLECVLQSSACGNINLHVLSFRSSSCQKTTTRWPQHAHTRVRREVCVCVSVSLCVCVRAPVYVSHVWKRTKTYQCCVYFWKSSLRSSFLILKQRDDIQQFREEGKGLWIQPNVIWAVECYISHLCSLHQSLFNSQVYMNYRLGTKCEVWDWPWEAGNDWLLVWANPNYHQVLVTVTIIDLRWQTVFL